MQQTLRRHVYTFINLEPLYTLGICTEQICVIWLKTNIFHDFNPFWNKYDDASRRSFSDVNATSVKHIRSSGLRHAFYPLTVFKVFAHLSIHLCKYLHHCLCMSAQPDTSNVERISRLAECNNKVLKTAGRQTQKFWTWKLASKTKSAPWGIFTVAKVPMVHIRMHELDSNSRNGSHI